MHPIHIVTKCWHQIVLPPEFGKDEVARVLGFSMVPIRFSTVLSPSVIVEISCMDEQEAAFHESWLFHALNDQRLRDEIASTASPEIQAFVDGMIRRSVDR